MNTRREESRRFALEWFQLYHPIRLLIVMVFMLSTPLFASERVSPKDLAEQIDGWFANLTATQPGAAVVVLRDGEVIHSKAYGLANLESGAPNTTHTKFLLASATKSFTALAVIQLAEHGRLHLEDSLSTYVADFVGGDQITLHHLLSHTAGLPDFIAFEEAKKQARDSAPGERLNYSNIGYLALGKVIEKASGKSYETYLKEAIFTPLGMQDSGVEHGQALEKDRAAGYVMGSDGKLRRADSSDQSSNPAAGGLYSTAEDMTRWVRALIQGRLVAPASLQKAMTPVRLNDGRKGSYGYGFMLIPFCGLREVAHGGDINGFNSYFALYPDERLAVIVLSNVGMRPPGPVPTAADIVHRVVKLVMGDRLGPDSPVEVKLPESLLDRYAGRYHLDAPLTITDAMGDTVEFSRELTSLFAGGKWGRMEVFAESETTFFSKGGPVPTKITFMVRPDGRVSEAVLSLMGLREFRLRRLP